MESVSYSHNIYQIIFNANNIFYFSLRRSNRFRHQNEIQIDFNMIKQIIYVNILILLTFDHFKVNEKTFSFLIALKYT